MAKPVAAIIAAVCVLLLVWFSYSQLFYTVDAAEIAVFQAPITGTLSVKTVPGTYVRLGSTVTSYKKRDLFSFSCDKGDDRSIQVRFNDGGHAQICGNVSWEMPADGEHVILLHTYFRSQENVDQQLVKNAIIAAMYQTSPLMSSTESYAARRSEFYSIFADQLQNGVYKTESVEVKQPDPITGEPKTVRVTNIVKDSSGNPLRQAKSPMGSFGINILPPTITNIVYDPEVEKNIQQQRDNIMQIQTAQAQAKRSEQMAITVQKQGEADAAKAKWDQEVKKAQAVTLAEQEKAVAETNALREKNVAETNAQRDFDVQKLRAETADQYKVEQSRLGEGDAARRAAVLAADGALQAKLDAWVKSQEAWANALANYRGNVVPQFVTGGMPGGQSSNGAMDFMNLMAMQAAKSLALDPTIPVPTTTPAPTAASAQKR